MIADLSNAMEDKVQIINKQQKDLEEATAFKSIGCLRCLHKIWSVQVPFSMFVLY